MANNQSGSTILKAATLPGEFEFLSQIIDDPNDQAKRLIYADWLEEQGEPDRAEFVRLLVDARKSLSKTPKLPDGSAFSQAWTTMLGFPLLAHLREEQNTKLCDAVFQIARPMLDLKTSVASDDDAPIGSTKFGGRPDLPKRTKWPRCVEGPLGFLCQFDLRELDGTQAGRLLPKDGLLSFFAYQDWESGISPGIEDLPGDAQVVYSSARSSLARRDPPDDLNEVGNQILPTCHVQIEESLDVPFTDWKFPPEQLDVKKVLVDGDAYEVLYAIKKECRSFGHHLLGYPLNFTTGDVTPGLEWFPLLVLISDDNLGWSWCDGDRLSVYVHKTDLKNQTFKRIYGYAG